MPSLHQQISFLAKNLMGHLSFMNAVKKFLIIKTFDTIQILQPLLNKLQW